MDLVSSEDPILLGKADLVDFSRKDLTRIVCQMLRIMLTNNGCGLAAPQIGVPLRIITFRYDGKMGAMINPVIESKSDAVIETKEGCLSFPDQIYKTKRSSSILLSYQDIEGKKRESVPIDGFMAVILQHECDHLDGVVLPQHGELLEKDER